MYTPDDLRAAQAEHEAWRQTVEDPSDLHPERCRIMRIVTAAKVRMIEAWLETAAGSTAAVGATGVGATGVGATGVGATGVGATGVGATGVGATGVGAATDAA